MSDKDLPVAGDESADAPTTEQREQLIEAIAERVIAQGGEVMERQIAGMVEDHFTALAADDEFVRRVRFGTPDPMGGKFRDLDAGDVEFLGALVTNPSQELQNALPEAYRKVESGMEFADRVTMHETRRGRRLSDGETLGRGVAMDTAESGYGSQLVGAQYVGSLWSASRKSARVYPLIRSFSMTAPTAYLPVEVNFPTVYLLSENTAGPGTEYTAVNTGSQRVTVTAKKLGFVQYWSGEMEEDSIIPYLPFLRGQAQKSLTWHMDALVLRGDTTTDATTNINDIADTPGGTEWFLAWDGIIHAAHTDNTANKRDAAGALTYEDFAEARKLMIDRTYFHNWSTPNNPSDLVWVAEPATAISASLLDEVITIDKYGSNATVVTGEIGNIGRNPLISCDALTLTTAAGAYDNDTAGNNTKGQIIGFNRNGYVIGNRRGLKVETERHTTRDQTSITYTWRDGFGRFTPTGAASGIESAAFIYDITV